MTGCFDYDQKYFERHYSGWIYRRYLDLRNRFIKHQVVKSISSGRFLEIGFGNDNLIKFFKDDFEVYGVDVSEFAVRKIQKQYPAERFKTADVGKEKLPFDKKFHVVCAINTIEHLANPRFALKNIYDLLNRGGALVLYLPTQSNIFSRFQYAIFYDVDEHLFRPSIRELRELLSGRGFYLSKEYTASLIPFKISRQLILESFNLYFGLWRK